MSSAQWWTILAYWRVDPAGEQAVARAEAGVLNPCLERGPSHLRDLELDGRAALDGVAARFAREQAGAGEGGQDDGHGQYAGATGPQGSVPVGIRPPSFRCRPEEHTSEVK